MRCLRLAVIGLLAIVPLVSIAAEVSLEREIPELLKPWVTWALWNDEMRDCPTPYNDSTSPLSLWPSRLVVQIVPTGGRFDFSVTVFHAAWVPLPGGSEAWPVGVKVNGLVHPVLPRENVPSVRLPIGTHRIEGEWRWAQIPQNLPVPREIGLLALTLDGQPVPSPSWDGAGRLWLQRATAAPEAEKDFLSKKIDAAIEDGIPMWLMTEIELIVSGKNREEQIGAVLPLGWKLSSVESALPVAFDDAGQMKAQVRAGKWTVRLTAFRLDHPAEFRFSPNVQPAVSDVLIAFGSKPEFRMVDVIGAPTIDVSQTTFPEKWRQWPVYRWDTSTAFRIEERMRGMGLQRPAPLTISRELWLDEDGQGFSFRDRLSGSMQQIWRLDAAAGQDLGSVRSQGQGLLITLNPETQAPGVEIRSRDIQLEATGRTANTSHISASGWRTDSEGLNVALNLPPGWRLFALFGADWVSGDWLTAWTLLDLFLLLIFTLAIFRLWGFWPSLVAFFAFAISYHEPSAPRLVWLMLLLPIALLRVVPTGWGRRLIVAWKWITILAFVFILVPFVVGQIQQALYPQLEKIGESEVPAWGGAVGFAAAPNVVNEYLDRSESSPQSVSRKREISSNLVQDFKARIQTGPGVPDWRWRTVSYGWNGPVQESQQVQPILIPLALERWLTILRVVLVFMLAGILLNARRLGAPLLRAAACFVALWLAVPSAQAQMPDGTMLQTLRERLLVVPDAYPHAADISAVSLSLKDRRLAMDVEVHTALRTAVPLPGQLASWSPVSLTVNGKADAVVRRVNGFLFVVLPPGVHKVRVEGLLADVTEWEWRFSLKPRAVTIDAPDWNVVGLRPDGVPEQQLFFSLKEKTVTGSSGYDRQDFESVAAVDRHIEIGLVWQVRTTVTRLSREPKAMALRVPILRGENILTSNVVASPDGLVEVRLGAHESSFTWESELTPVESLALVTKAEDAWVERWRLVASPVWNVAISGLPPIFEPNNAELVPVWNPWPGESVELKISRPAAIPGATVTVQSANHSTTLGSRQRVSELALALQCSVGEDFIIGLPAAAEVTALTQNGQSLPVRKDGDGIIVPLRPGEQSIALSWKTDIPLGSQATADRVTLPVESANITSIVNVPDSRWVLWTSGPLRGPAVRFWTVLICALLAAWILGRIPRSPLSTTSWMLLALGLTQVPLAAAFLVVAWLFFLSWRGGESFRKFSPLPYNVLQILLIALTATALGIFIAVVAEGLLGSPEMFIIGNGSTRTALQWYLARCESVLPEVGCFSISIWWYRLLMLVWALWLAAALIGWLRWAWTQFSSGGVFHRTARASATPPPLSPENS